MNEPTKLFIGPVGSGPSEWLEVGYVVDDPDPVAVAKAALCEAGRPDIAERVKANRAGWPSVPHTDVDHEVIARAFYLAHIASGHRARLGVDFTGRLGITCHECEAFR